MPEIKIVHDGSFDLATAKTSKAAKWQNREWQWSEFLTKISETHRTHETYNEYITAKKQRQDEIKNIGGFLGGYLNNGSRKAGSVLHRQLLTLDIDFGNAAFWDDFTMSYLNAAAVYSTHKHQPEKPRLRLIVPLSRPVFADEYQAIARKVAGNIDIELFDPTTFQPERLMYWPSSPKDAEYIFQYQDGEWLDADEILNSYTNWKDSSEWPISVKVDKVLRHTIEKQGDPLEKTGVVGAFCRTFTISEAIAEFLPDRYEECVDGRYTYKEGSTTAGLVVYDDKFAYSHHGTDPTSGKLCNAFDLVRIHKFGLKDEDAREGTPNNKMPSYVAMSDFASKDARVKKLIVAEKAEEAKTAFEGIDDLEEEDSDDWKEKLDVDRKGNIYNTIDNALLVLSNDPYFKGRIAYDDFEKCEVALKDLPWRKITASNRRLVDRDDANIRHYLEKTYGISSAVKIKDAMEVITEKTSFHPVKDYLNSLEWDGEKRLDTLFVEYQGAVDTKYTRAVTRKALVAAVKRIFKPGCKFDYIITLVGKQGLKKSSIIFKLGRQWFSDSFSTIKGKESFEQLQGVWLVEIAELSGLSRGELEDTKKYITKRDDRYRVAYGRRTEKFPRQCIFFATTNKVDFLRDPTGNRRYWPIQVHIAEPTKDVMEDLTDEVVDQIWAEAMMYYRKGEQIYLEPELEKTAEEIQRQHTEEHPWTGIINQYLDTKLPEHWDKLNKYERRQFLIGDEIQTVGEFYRSKVCIMEIWCEALGRNESIDERSTNVIRNIMRLNTDWQEDNKRKRYSLYGQQRKGFFRLNAPGKVLADTVDELLGDILN